MDRWSIDTAGRHEAAPAMTVVRATLGAGMNREGDGPARTVFRITAECIHGDAAKREVMVAQAARDVALAAHAPALLVALRTLTETMEAARDAGARVDPGHMPQNIANARVVLTSLAKMEAMAEGWLAPLPAEAQAERRAA